MEHGRAVPAQTLQLQLVALHMEAVFAGEPHEFVFELFVFGERQRNAAPQASGMVMVLVKQATQFQPILPTGLQALDDANFFEEAYGAVHGSAVDCFAAAYKLVHGQRAGALQGTENR